MRRAALLLMGAVSFTALTAAPSARAQGFGGLNPGAAAGTPFPTLGWKPGVGQSPAAASANGSGINSVITPPPTLYLNPYANPYGGYGVPYGGYGSPYGYGGGYGGYGGYGSPGGYGGNFRSQQFTPDGAQMMGVPPDSQANATPTETRATLGGSASLITPPTVQTNTNYAPAYYGGGPTALSGYYYSGYCDSPAGPDAYPSVYGVYDGFPAYMDISAPGLTISDLSAPVVYAAEPQPFLPPTYTVTYNQTNYYVTNEARAGDISQGGEAAQAAVKRAYPADSFQAAFADIERAWDNGDVTLLKKHLRSDDTKISVSLSSAYKYSLNSSDFAQITRDAFDRLNTVSFKFTALQRAKNGDVTAYGTHVYQPEGGAGDGSVVAFDPDDAGAAVAAKTVYVSYTLRHGDTGWYVTAINSSTVPLLKTAP